MHGDRWLLRRRRRYLESPLCTYLRPSLSPGSVGRPAGPPPARRNPSSRVTAGFQPREESRDTFVWRRSACFHGRLINRVSGGFHVEAPFRKLVSHIYKSHARWIPFFFFWAAVIIFFFHLPFCAGYKRVVFGLSLRFTSTFLKQDFKSLIDVVYNREIRRRQDVWCDRINLKIQSL